MQEGDVLGVWRLERLALTLKHLVATVNHLQKRGIGFQSLQEPIDTASEEGRLVFQACTILAQAERDMILKALKETEWNRKKAAKQLGVSDKTLHNRIDEFNLKP